MGPTGVVGDHAAERGATGRGRVGPEGQPILAADLHQVAQNDPWLHDGGARHRVEVDDVIHVPGHVDHDATDRVAGHARTSRTQHRRGAGLSTYRERGKQVLLIDRDHHGLRNHPVVAGVDGVQRLSQGAGLNPPSHVRSKVPRGSRGKRGHRGPLLQGGRSRPQCCRHCRQS